MGRKKKEALVQFNQENILHAAGSLFESKGISLTTMDEIAREADCSKSTMYVYFKNKDELVQHIIFKQMSGLKELLEQCVEESSDFKDCFLRICRKLAQFQEEHPVYFELLLGEIKVTKEDIEQGTIAGKIYEVGEQVNDLIAELLQQGIQKGQIKSDIRLIETVFFLWSGISEMVRFANAKQQYLQMRLGIRKEEYVEYAAELLLRSIQP